MRSLLQSQGKACRPCVLGCGWDEDSVQHYGRCKIYWEFVSTTRKGGLGIPLSNRSAEAFLLLSRLDPEDQIRLALGMYALYRTVNLLRHHPQSELNPVDLMTRFLRRAAAGSKAVRLLV